MISSNRLINYRDYFFNVLKGTSVLDMLSMIRKKFSKKPPCASGTHGGVSTIHYKICKVLLILMAISSRRKAPPNSKRPRRFWLQIQSKTPDPVP
jgi:hypothetical protein